MALCSNCGKRFDADKATREQINARGTIFCSYTCSTQPAEIDWRNRAEKAEAELAEKSKQLEIVASSLNMQIERLLKVEAELTAMKAREERLLALYAVER